MKFTVITLFPDLIGGVVGHGLLGQAQGKGLLAVETLNPREFTEDAHHTVDDRAFGGGDGMVMKVEPLARALEAVRAKSDVSRVVVLTPQGEAFSQDLARAWAEEGGHTVLVCGRYAGIDQRFIVQHADMEVSLGDFILNGGEIAACAMIESVSRLIPGALGNGASAVRDSFMNGLLEAPQFTRPREIDGLPVPAPLLSGNHALIAKFERAVSEIRTALLRVDLCDRVSAASIAMLEQLSDAELLSLDITRDELLELQRRELLS